MDNQLSKALKLRNDIANNYDQRKGSQKDLSIKYGVSEKVVRTITTGDGKVYGVNRKPRPPIAHITTPGVKDLMKLIEKGKI